MVNKEVAKILLKVRAITLRINPPYKWTSGILAPIYTDNRLLMSYPKEREKVVDYLIKILKKNRIKFDVIAGTATAAIPWASWLAQKLKKPMIYVRKSTKKHGKEKLIEGKLEKGKKVLVVEDLISTGGSSLSTLQSVRKSKGKVNCCLAIFTYQMKSSKRNFKKNKCKLLTLTDFGTLVDVASKSGYIKNKEKDLVLSWCGDPFNWYKRLK